MNTRSSAVRTGAVACLATAILASGGIAAHAATPNGEAGKPAKTVLADSTKALEAVKSVRIAASIKDGKQTLAFAFTYVNGKGETGSFSEGKIKADIVVIGKDLYFRGNAALVGNGTGKALADKWIHVSTSSTYGKGFSDITNFKSFASSVLSPTKLKSTVGRGAVGNTPALVLTDSENSKLFIAATGAPLPLKITGARSEPGTATFTNYNKPFTLKKPAKYISLPTS